MQRGAKVKQWLDATWPLGHINCPMTVKHKTLAEVESDHIVAVLKANRMNMTRTARALGLDRRTLYRKLPPLGWCERARRQWVWELEQGEREA